MRKYLTTRYIRHYEPRHLRSNNNQQYEQSRLCEHNEEFSWIAGRGMDDLHTRAVVRVLRWKQKKKMKKRTITRRTARWATSKLSRGRIQPYIGVDTVPRSCGNAQSNAPLGGTCEWKKKREKKKKNVMACVNYALYKSREKNK